MRKRRKKLKRGQKNGPQTKWERKFFQMLERRNIKFRCNEKFRCVSGRICFPDFLLDCGIVVEIDGKSRHSSGNQRLNDRLRTEDLEASGIKRVLRLWNSDVDKGSDDPNVRFVLGECLRQDRRDLIDNLLMNVSPRRVS